MILTVLGCWAPYPRPGGACSGYLLQSGETAIMIDAGNGTFAELTRHVNFRSLKALVITHFHPDHYVDVFCLRHAIAGARRAGTLQQTLKLFVPAAPSEIYNKLASYTDAFTVTAVEQLPETRQLGIHAKWAKLDNTEMFFVPTAHALPGYALLVRRNGKSFFFSGDTAATDQITLAAGDSDLFLCEASGLDQDKEYLAGIHMTAREAGLTAQKAKVKKLVITHFWPEYELSDLLAQAGEGFNGDVTAAIQGMKVNL